MIQKFLAKYILEVIPSIVATVIGAYIVTHYINSKPDADKPAATASSPATPVKAVAEPVKPETLKSEAAKAETARSASPKVEPVKSEATVEIEKSGEKSAQAARVLRHHQIVVKERAAKAAVQEKTVPVEASATPEDRRDANDIARAAIERLRGAEPRAAEMKPPERKVNTVGYAPASAPVQSYTPPPVQASPPAAAYVPPSTREAAIPAQAPVMNSPNMNSPAINPPAMTPLPSENVSPLPMPPPPVARVEDASRPTPPADIPPLDIRAKDTGKQNTSVAEDVVSAAKNAFQSVMPR